MNSNFTRNGLRIIALTAGVLCLIAAVLLISRLIYYRRTTGKIEFSPVSTQKGTLMLPMVAYTKEGASWGIRPPTTELPAGFEDGDKIDVLYEPYGQGAVIAKTQLWYYPIILILVGVLLIMVTRTEQSKRFMDAECGHKAWAQNLLLVAFACLALSGLGLLYAAIHGFNIMTTDEPESIWIVTLGLGKQLVWSAALGGICLGVSATVIYQVIRRKSIKTRSYLT